MIKVLVRDRHPVRGEQPIDVEVIEMLASDVVLPGGMTKAMAVAFLKACRDQLLASAGYA